MKSGIIFFSVTILAFVLFLIYHTIGLAFYRLFKWKNDSVNFNSKIIVYADECIIVDNKMNVVKNVGFTFPDISGKGSDDRKNELHLMYNKNGHMFISAPIYETIGELTLLLKRAKPFTIRFNSHKLTLYEFDISSLLKELQ